MKTKIIYTFFLIISIISLNLKAQPAKIEKENNQFENCYNSLKNDNKGVVESAIFVSIQFKNKYPEKSLTNFKEALDNLANNSDNPRISYKAQLAIMYIKNYELFKNVEVKSIFDEQRVYEEISKTLNNIMLAGI